MPFARLAAGSAAALACLIAAAPAEANRESTAFAVQAADHVYNLEHDRAIAAARQAVAADPEDARAYRSLTSALWLSITFRRGNMTVDDYLGSVSRRQTTAAPPPTDTAAQFQEALDRALLLARKRIVANPQDAEAHYQLGAAVGLRASYMATVENSTAGAFRSAREAYKEHEAVLQLDSRRRDAGLIVGTYRYIVAALALPLRWVAYAAGFGGDRARGVRFIEDAAEYVGDNQTDSRLALVLIYNREKRYDDALKQLAIVREHYPSNRLVWLETGATSLRAGRPADAERFLTEGLARFANDARPRMFGEQALWYYKRGAARAALGSTADAEQDLATAVATEGRPWVHGRAHLELGKLAVKAGRPMAARPHLENAVALSTSDNDPTTAADARQLLK